MQFLPASNLEHHSDKFQNSILLVLIKPGTELHQHVAEYKVCHLYSGTASRARVEASSLTAILRLCQWSPQQESSHYRLYSESIILMCF